MGWLLSWFTGPIFGALFSTLVNAYKAKLDSTNNTEAHAVDIAKAEILGEIAMKQEAAKVVIAEQGRWYTAIIRPLFAFPLIIYVNKVILWDKVLGWGSTDVIAGSVGDWAGWIIAAYFVTRPFEKIASKVLARR